MARSNIEIEIFRYKNTVFGSLLYIDPALAAAYPDGLIEKCSGSGNSFGIYTCDSSCGTELDSDNLEICADSSEGENAVFRSFSYSYDNESDAELYCELFKLAIEKVNKLETKPLARVRKKPGEIITVLSIN